MADDQSQAKTLHLTSDDFDQKLEESKENDMPIMVDFYADWCGPCKMAAPVIDKLSNTYDGKAMIAKLNVDENNAVAQKYQVMSIPTVIMFKGGEEVDRKIGFAGEQGYVEMLNKVVADAE